MSIERKNCNWLKFKFRHFFGHHFPAARPLNDFFFHCKVVMYPNSGIIKIMPNIISRKVTIILLARFALSLKVYRRSSHKLRNFAIIILLSEKRENSEMILREREVGGIINYVIRYVCFTVDKTILYMAPVRRRWWQMYCAPLACKPPLYGQNLDPPMTGSFFNAILTVNLSISCFMFKACSLNHDTTITSCV